MKHIRDIESARRSPIRGGSGPALRAMCVAVLATLTAGVGHGQLSSHPAFPQPIGQPVGGGLDSIPNGGAADNERVLQALNADRQKSLVLDTDKLVRLANALSAEIARTNPESLSADELNKLAEIEKLAHKVKDKMSTSVRGTPAYEPARRQTR